MELKSDTIKVVDYQPEFKQAFTDLNKEWISSYFKLEEADYKVLNDPDQSIIANGGHIFVAVYQGNAVGVCALLRDTHAKYAFELAKMAVSPMVRGKGAGWLLAQAAIAKAKELGALNLYLESNTVLKPALNLYRKLGFQEVSGCGSPYERCNIQMVLHFSSQA